MSTEIEWCKRCKWVPVPFSKYQRPVMNLNSTKVCRYDTYCRYECSVCGGTKTDKVRS